jgi:hypothetical protein
LPVLATSALKTFRRPTGGRVVSTALWLTLTAVLSVHIAIIAIILMLVLWLFSLRRARARALAAGFAAMLILFVLLSSFFIIPALNSGALTARVGRADLEAFRTRSSSVAGVGVSVAGLYGFWKLQLDALLPKRYLPVWPLIIAVLLLLSIAGAVRAWREPTRGPLVKALVVCAVLGFLLALGSATPVTGRVFLFLYDHLAVAKLFREPQKFAALLALAYSMLGAIGLERILNGRPRDTRDRRALKAGVLIVLLLLVFGYTFRTFGGLWGQARPVTYPASWAEAKTYLDREAGDSRVLYMPPYWYMRFEFTGSPETITSPLPTYFVQPNLVGVSIEVAGRRLDEGPIDRYLEAALSSAKERGNLGAMLAPLDVRYVVFALNPASEGYSYLLRQKDLTVARRWDDLVLLKNSVPVERVMLAERKGGYSTFSGLARAAHGANLTGSHISKAAVTDVPEAAALTTKITVSGGRLLTFELPAAATPRDTILLGETYDRYWRIGGRPTLKQVGVSCAFPVLAGDGGALTVRYFNPYLLIGYLLTGAGLLLCAALLVHDRHGTRSNTEEAGTSEREDG